MFARTARLTLRPGWPEDAPALAAAIGDRDAAATVSHVPPSFPEGDLRERLARPPATGASLLILAHEGGPPRLVGGGGLHADDAGGWELALWLVPDARGRGYATEAGRALVGMARHALGLDRLAARHLLADPASGRVLEKLGFRRMGVGEMPCRVRGGEALPCAAYALDLVERPALAEAA